MGLFSAADLAEINKVAAKSKELITPTKSTTTKNMNAELNEMSQAVLEYFKDSPAILIESVDQLHEYITKAIESGYAGIDTETTGLDRIHDTIVGASLYYPGGVECYIPSKHLVPIFDEPYRNQLSYEDIGKEFQRLADSNIKLIFANADFDLAMIYKDLKVDLSDRCYYDVILAWRCLKENEPNNQLKVLYNKYVLRGKGDPKRFSDFFTPKMFPYCKPDVAKLYAANDAKITYELFKWQLPYVTRDHPKCKKAHLEKIADLLWNVELPLISVCQNLHRLGMYVEKSTADVLAVRYHKKEADEQAILADMVDAELEKSTTISAFSKKPFTSGSMFNPKSIVHVKYLLYTVMNLPQSKNGGSTDKEVLKEFNLPITNQILKVRSLGVLLGTFVDKMPNATTSDSRIHARFNQIGADTGRLSSSEPNMMNIPSHAPDIRHMFRATPGYVMLSSDYSRQEPAITSFVSGDKGMIDSFKQDRDIYATIASLAFNVPYEKCLEFHPETHEYQPDGKARRGEAKVILLGISYGRAIPSIAEQLYNTRDDMSDEEKIKGAQKVYDSVLNAFPGLRQLMLSAQNSAKKRGYTETILGRRRHIPDMQLPEYEFKAMSGYVNPDVDPLDPATLKNKDDIPERIKTALLQELKGYKYFGQVANRMRQLHDEEHIKVINNRSKIQDATRQCANSVIQGSAADMTKLAILNLFHDEEWNKIGGRLLTPVHDELICEVPIEYWKEGGEALSRCMLDAASFLPFGMTCDVTTTLRWYGLEYPCKYPKPDTLTGLDSDHIKWVQYQLYETEYLLPIYKDENGEKPRGDAALGVNGVESDEYFAAIADYKKRHNISSDEEFIDHIERKVIYG